MTEDRKQFPTGAVRSKDADGVRYDLISHIGLRRLAETYAEGAKKYDDHNWLKGFPASDVLNHTMRHIELWRGGDRTEDHLAHAAWNLFALMHFEETRPDLMNVPPKNVPGTLPQWWCKRCEGAKGPLQVTYGDQCCTCGEPVERMPTK